MLTPIPGDDPRLVLQAALATVMLLLAGLPLALAATLPAYTPDANTTRAQIPDVYLWDLSPLFASDADWQAAEAKLRNEIPRLAPFAGRLTEPAALADCLDLYFRLHREANYVTLYPNLRQSTALSDDDAGSMVQRSLATMDELMAAASFIRRELLAMAPEALTAAFAAEPRLGPYRPYIDNLRRRASRILSPDAERVLSLLGDNLWAEIDLNEIPSASEDAFAGLMTDVTWPEIVDADGGKVRLTLANYPHFRRSPNRAIRQAAVAAFFGTLRQYQHVLAATLGGQAELDVAYARSRGYDTALEAYLDKDGLDVAVYDALVQTVGDNLNLMHRYVNLRKKLLGLPDIHLYDLYIPLVPDVDADVPFPRARQMLLAGLAPLGDEYGAVLAEGLDPANGWLDLYPHADKRSGAFSSSAYGVHPWVLMNYMDSLDDMSTLAHEYGHALHSHFSMQAQPYSSFRYPPFLAEIASTCNEALLSEHMVANASSPAEKAYLLASRLEDMRTTIFRQTMFAAFERQVHELVEAGTPVTSARLEELYLALVRAYYGPGFTVDEDDGMEWAYIPHFYYKYYVYTYATGMVAGIAVADRVRTLGDEAVADYMQMLSGGCSAPPLDLLRRAGVDLTTPAPIEAAMRAFERTLDEVETLLVLSGK